MNLLTNIFLSVIFFFHSIWNKLSEEQKKKVIEGIIEFFKKIFEDFYDQCKKDKGDGIHG